MFWRFIHVVVCICISLTFTAEYFILFLYHNLFFIYLFVDIWTVYMLLPLWTANCYEHAYTQTCSSTCFQIWRHTHTKNRIWTHVVIVYLTFWETTKMFSTVAEPFCNRIVQDSDFAASLPTLVIFCFLITLILVGVK
jgi:hypothetical protein